MWIQNLSAIIFGLTYTCYYGRKLSVKCLQLYQFMLLSRKSHLRFEKLGILVTIPQEQESYLFCQTWLQSYKSFDILVGLCVWHTVFMGFVIFFLFFWSNSFFSRPSDKCTATAHCYGTRVNMNLYRYSLPFLL